MWWTFIFFKIRLAFVWSGIIWWKRQSLITISTIKTRESMINQTNLCSKKKNQTNLCSIWSENLQLFAICKMYSGFSFHSSVGLCSPKWIGGGKWRDMWSCDLWKCRCEVILPKYKWVLWGVQTWKVAVWKYGILSIYAWF